MHKAIIPSTGERSDKRRCATRFGQQREAAGLACCCSAQRSPTERACDDAIRAGGISAAKERSPDNVRPVQGGQYPRLVTSFERAERNQAIVTARLRGLGERHVAEMYEVSERHVRRVLREYRESRTAWHELDPVQALKDTLGAYETLIHEAEVLTDQAKQESTRLGAVKLVLDRHGVPEHVQQEIVDTVEGRLPAGPEAAEGETPDETSAAGYDSVEPVDAAAALAGS
jgi:transposase